MYRNAFCPQSACMSSFRVQSVCMSLSDSLLLDQLSATACWRAILRLLSDKLFLKSVNNSVATVFQSVIIFVNIFTIIMFCSLQQTSWQRQVRLIIYECKHHWHSHRYCSFAVLIYLKFRKLDIKPIGYSYHCRVRWLGFPCKAYSRKYFWLSTWLGLAV